MVPSSVDEAHVADRATPVTEEERARIWWASHDVAKDQRPERTESVRDTLTGIDGESR